MIEGAKVRPSQQALREVQVNDLLEASHSRDQSELERRGRVAEAAASSRRTRARIWV